MSPAPSAPPSHAFLKATGNYESQGWERDGSEAVRQRRVGCSLGRRLSWRGRLMAELGTWRESEQVLEPRGR